MAASDFKLIRPITIVDALVTSNNVTEADATEWLPATNFSTGQTCMVTTTTNGADVATHGIYKSIHVGTNTNYDPTDANGALYWELTGYTNAWKMFDPEYQTQTVFADTIEVEFTPTTGVNSVALLNVNAASATILQGTTGYTETKSLIRHGVLGWYDWFFESPVRVADVVFSDIPPYIGETLTVTLDSTGSDAKCGIMVIGKQKILGATQWEANRSINDYSQAIESSTGVVSLTQGAYSKRLNMEFKVIPGFESEATRVLEEYRATPIVFVGSDEYAMTIIYGFLGSWAVPISNTGRNAFVEIKGLI
jgi:hypothetical protein